MLWVWTRNEPGYLYKTLFSSLHVLFTFQKSKQIPTVVLFKCTYFIYLYCTPLLHLNIFEKIGRGAIEDYPLIIPTYLFTYIAHSDDTTTLAPDDTTTEMDTEAPTTIFETTTISTTTTTTTTESTNSCHAKGIWSRTPGMDHWCTLNCNHIPPFCPATHCTCDWNSKNNKWFS